MNANADTNIKPTTAEIEQRLLAERNRLNDELNLQSRLQAQRLPALESGDDKALDIVEANLSKCVDRQNRIEERIGILTHRLEESKAADEAARLNEIAAAADRSRADAEKLIRTEYVALAKKMAAVLAKLKASDDEIDAANRELEKAKRPIVASANAIRCRPMERFTWSKKVVISPADARHPNYGDADYLASSQAWYSKTLRTSVANVEIAEEQTDIVRGDHQDPLWKTIILPRIDPQGAPYVHANGHQVMPGTTPADIWNGPTKAREYEHE